MSRIDPMIPLYLTGVWGKMGVCHIKLIDKHIDLKYEYACKINKEGILAFFRNIKDAKLIAKLNDWVYLGKIKHI